MRKRQRPTAQSARRSGRAPTRSAAERAGLRRSTSTRRVVARAPGRPVMWTVRHSTGGGAGVAASRARPPSPGAGRSPASPTARRGGRAASAARRRSIVSRTSCTSAHQARASDPDMPFFVLFRGLTGLADGLARKESRCACGDSPQQTGSPAPTPARSTRATTRDSADFGGRHPSNDAGPERRSMRGPYGPVRTVPATCGNYRRLATARRPLPPGDRYRPVTATAQRPLPLTPGDRGDEVRDVLSVLAVDEPGRHLAIAPRATLLDRVEDQRLRRRELVEVRAHAAHG